MRTVNALTGLNVVLYRVTGGRVLGAHLGAPILLLDHVGRRTGARRTTPLIYLEDGDDLVVVGSRGGSDANPGWLFNLHARPETEVQVRSDRRKVVARQASPAQKQRLWPRLVATYPNYALYERRTTRDIPVVLLSPAR